MSRRKPFVIGCLIVAIVGLSAAAVGIVLFVRRLPDIAAQIPRVPTLVTLSFPPDRSLHMAGAPIEVRAKAISASPLRLMELWADGQLATNAIPEEGDTGVFRGVFTWTATTEGEHVLFVRALDEQARVAQSNVIRVKTTYQSYAVQLEPVIVAQGDTLESLAQQHGVSPEMILGYNGNVGPDGSLSPGQEIGIPIPFPDAQPPEAPPASLPAGPAGPVIPASGAPSKLEAWVNENLLPKPPGPPIPPGLHAAAQGCGVDLAVVDQSANEDGFFVYRFDPNGSAFERIATLGDGSGNLGYRDEGLYGSYAYYVAAFNTDGEIPGGAAVVEVADAACGVSDWTGLKLQGGQLELPQAVDLAYFYLSINAGPWVRVPQQPGAFLKPSGATADASEHLAAALSAAPGDEFTLALEAWGWSGGALVYLGSGGGTIKKASSAVEANWPWDHTELKVCRTVTSCVKDFALNFATEVPGEFFHTPGPVDFKLNTQFHAPVAFRWQVSRFPLPKTPDLEFFGLLAQGVVIAKQVSQEFTIDFTPIITGKVAVNPGGQFNASTGQGGIQVVGPASGLGGEPAAGGASSAGPAIADLSYAQVSAQLEPGQGVAKGSFIDPEQPQTFYVRLLPVDEHGVIGKPSDTVVLHYDPSKKPGPVEIIGHQYESRIVGYQEPDYADPGRWGCLLVVKNPYFNNAPAYFAQGGNMWTMYIWAVSAPENSVVCPENYEGPSWWEKALDVVLTPFEWAHEAYEWPKDQIVKVVMSIPGLKDACKKWASEQDCKDVLKGGVEAGLMAFGLPPEIPNAKDLADQGVDYLVEKGVEQLKSIGVPCVGPCEEKLKEIIKDQLHEVFDTSVSPGCVGEDEAKAHGRYPLCPSAGMVVKPAPGAVAQPPVVVVEVVRVDEYVGSCSMTVELRTTISKVSGTMKGPNGAFSVQDAAVEAIPYHPQTVTLPQLDLYQYVRIPIALGEPILIEGGTFVTLLSDNQQYWFSDFKDVVSGYGEITVQTEQEVNGQPCVRGDSEVVVPWTPDY